MAWQVPPELTTVWLNFSFCNSNLVKPTSAVTESHRLEGEPKLMREEWMRTNAAVAPPRQLSWPLGYCTGAGMGIRGNEPLSPSA